MQRLLSDFLNKDLIQSLGLLERRGDTEGFLDPLISGLSYDSRKIEKGFAYFALKGLHTDGHSYIGKALERGAVLIIHQDPLPDYRKGIVYLQVQDSRKAMSPLAAAFWNFPSQDLAIIGVTGTEGKSTTVFLVYQLLDLLGKKTGFISTVQFRTGAKVEWNPEHQTTPEATSIHASLAAMRDSLMEYAVIESSSHGLSPQTSRLANVHFDVGIMTNVTHEHLEFHGTWEQYREDKANLFRALDANSHEKGIFSATPGSDGQRGTVRIPSFGVLNADDPSAAFFAAATERRSYTFSVRGSDADLSMKSIQGKALGNTYEVLVRSTEETLLIQDYLPGTFNAGNVLAALLTVSGLLDIPIANLVPLVAQLQPVRGRMSLIDAGQDFEVLVDYAHTPSSFQTVLPSIKKRLEDRDRKLISVFGSGGERDREKRPLQGRIAADWSDIVILTDEDPRGEEPMELLEEIAAGCPERIRNQDLFLIPDRPSAIRKAYELAGEGDAVILLGKGHENSIIYKDKTITYDEIEEAYKALYEIGFHDRKEVEL
ncbi:UDP-N-acetylmuramoyl-L-alanyl-D-glutamate--2,6-diaminopimelate ligase [Treponema sp.]